MNIEDFTKPERKAFGMLDGKIRRASEGEDILGWMLRDCVEAGRFIPLKQKCSSIEEYCQAYENLLDIRYLEMDSQGRYILTEYAKKTLHRYYPAGDIHEPKR